MQAFPKTADDTLEHRKCPILPRNEGVPGSSPGVGFQSRSQICRVPQTRFVLPGERLGSMVGELGVRGSPRGPVVGDGRGCGERVR